MTNNAGKNSELCHCVDLFHPVEIFHMSDTAIFILAHTDGLKSSGQLPGDIRQLQQLAEDAERIVHTECILAGGSAEKAIQHVRRNAGSVVLLSDASTEVALSGQLLLRLHEYVAAYPHISQFVLAGTSADQLSPASAFLRKAGCSVTLATSEKPESDATQLNADELAAWGEGGRNTRSETRAKRADQDPYEILVEEVTKGRQRGRRVLLTSLKQRMRKRIRRFDETKLKDEQGRPMRKFKDFVQDAANRGMVQLIDRGNASHVLLPDEEYDESQEAELPAKKETAPEGVDPLLDSVDLVPGADGEEALGESDDSEEASDIEEPEDGSEEQDVPEQDEEEDIPHLLESDLDLETLDEDTDPPPVDFVETLQEILSTDEGPLSLQAILNQLEGLQREDKLDVTLTQIREWMQATMNNELLEVSGSGKPETYLLADDWRDIIGYL